MATGGQQKGGAKKDLTLETLAGMQVSCGQSHRDPDYSSQVISYELGQKYRWHAA